MTDIFERVKETVSPLGQYRERGEGYFLFPELEGEISPKMRFLGREVLTWSLNNYLGLANNPEVRRVDAEAAKQYGLAYPMGSRMMSGQTKEHAELERRLAKFENKEAAYLLNFGYQGMVSIIDVLTTHRDVIVYDSDSHACIMDGIFLHKAKGGKSFAFPHNDMQRAAKMLRFATKNAEANNGGILVITEGVFGMIGDLGNLPELIKLKQDFNFRLMIDDAHGFGTMGNTGAGTSEHFNCQNDIDIYFATFAKSMAGIGAFVAGNKDIIDVLRYNMRSQIFAKSLPMPMVIGAMKRLEMLQNEPEHRQKLWQIATALQQGLRDNGFNIGHTQSPVTPVIFNASLPEATNIVVDLRENYNIFCSVVVYPVVPKGVVMLRIIPTAAHTLEHVKLTIDVFKKIKAKLDAGEYKCNQIQDKSVDL